MKIDNSDLDISRIAKVAWPTRAFVGLAIWFGSLIILYAIAGQEFLYTSTGLYLFVTSIIISFAGYDTVLESSSANAHRPNFTSDEISRKFIAFAGINFTGIFLFYTATSDVFKLLFNTGTFFISMILIGGALAFIFGFFGGGYAAGLGFALGSVLLAVSTFTNWIGTSNTGIFIEVGHPWIPALTIGGIHIGIIGNIILSVWVVVSISVSLLWLIVQFVNLPWRHRYEYGYRVRPGIWQGLLVGLVSIVIGVPLLSIPQFGIQGIDFWPLALYALFGAPVTLGIPYYCRLRIERIIRQSA